MVKQADEVKYVGDMISNVELQLLSSKSKILEATKVFEDRNVSSIHFALSQVVNRIDGYMQKKHTNTIKETMLA